MNMEQLNDYIHKIIKTEIKKAQFDRKVRAVVQSVGLGVATISLLDSTQTISNVPIRTGLSLSPADSVYVTCINGSINNIFIDVKIN